MTSVVYSQIYIDYPDGKILHTRVQNLTWSHIRALLRVDNPEARSWYMKEASEQMWSVRKICCVRLTDKKSSISCKRKKKGAVAGLKFYMIFTLNVAKGTHPLFVGNIGSDMSGSFATSP